MVPAWATPSSLARQEWRGETLEKDALGLLPIVDSDGIRADRSI